nr:uncharacterized protein LOC124810008 isoform X2 [Hydra vulgaris]
MQKDPDTLYKKEVDKTKGFGVFSFEKIQKGQFIAQYRGDLVPKKEMNNKIQYYEKTNAGSYVYDFLHNNIEYSIDATFHFNYIGRYFNDSKYYPNAIMKKVVLNNTPSLCLFALKDIEPNEEILYFYGVDNLIWHTEELKRKNQKRNKSKACSPTIKNIASYEAAEDIDFGVECTISNSPFHNSSLEVRVCSSITKETELDVKELLDSDYEGKKITIANSPSPEAYSPTIKNIASDSKAVEDLNIDFGVENAISNSPFDNSSLEVHACSSIEKDTDLDEEETNSKDFDKKEFHPEKLVHLSKMSNTKVKSMKKKPGRICIFCNKIQSRLTRHITLKHKDIETVKSALNLPDREKLKMFDKFKKEGIKKYNIDQTKELNPNFQRERKAKKTCKDTAENLEMCGHCNGFFSKRFLSRHSKNCDLNNLKSTIHIPLSLIKDNFLSSFPNEFVTNVLGNMRNDDVGKICKQDDIILTVGLRLYDKMKRKCDKASEVLKSVRNDMRRLGNLYSIFRRNEKVHKKYSNSMDMFNRINFDILRNAIDEYTISENCLKSGLKIVLSSLIKKAAKIIKGTILTQNDKNLTYEENNKLVLEKVQDIDLFVSVFETWKGYIFGDAEYDINKKRHQKLRRPTNLPEEKDVQVLQNYILQRIESIMNDRFIFWDSHTFIELRDMVCTRLTLLNARRGGEPARLLLNDWKDAEDGAWIKPQHIKELNQLDKKLANSIQVAYMTGKGNNHLVPVLIPLDSFAVLRKLADLKIRKEAGILENNPYLFPSTKNSTNHVSGWHALHAICMKIKNNLIKPNKLTATSNRRRVSTLFAMLNLPPQERELFYQHMGHSQAINQNVYQAPPALLEILKVGRHLIDLENGIQKNAINTVPQTSTSDWMEHIEDSSDGKNYDNDWVIDTVSSKQMNAINTVPQPSTSDWKDHTDDSSDDRDDCDNDWTLDTVSRKKNNKRVNLNEQNETGLYKKRKKTELLHNKIAENKTGRSYFQWSKEQIKHFYSVFGSFITGANQEYFPALKQIKEFSEHYKIDLHKVRTKINNERKKLINLQKKRIKEMNISNI